MPQDRLIRPRYADRFRCIGGACEDTCCQGWHVPLDRATYEKYKNMPDVPLRALLHANMVGPDEGLKPKDDKSYAQMRMTAANRCPMLREDGLCSLQCAYGEEMLGHVCAVFPRNIHQIDAYREVSLSLSCPEAARLVLLDPDLFAPDLLREETTPAEDAASDAHRAEQAERANLNNVEKLLAWFWPIRAAVLGMVRNREYPLWQRLFLLGVFCHRLDAIGHGELARAVPEFLRDFEATVQGGLLRSAMDQLPVDREAQLDVILRLSGSMLHRSNVRPRFVECVQAFTSGLGNGPQATLQSLAERFDLAHDRYFAPFMDRHPHILENYLVNTMLRGNFPFGKEARELGTEFLMAKECSMLTAQLALMRGLLIGVAGHHRENFSAAHVVHTFQAAAKHFEHHPDFLNQAYTLLVESRMDGARGMAILLRNTPPRPQPATVEVRLPAVTATAAASAIAPQQL